MIDCYPTTAPLRSSEPSFEQEPVTLARARRQVGNGGLADSNTFYDEQLRDYIITARRKVEHDARIACYTGTFTWEFTDWPSYRDWFEIPDLRPVTAISSIAYIDTTGTSQTWSSAEYSLENSGEAAAKRKLSPLVRLNDGYVWPTIRGDINGITVTMTAGFSTVLAVPIDVKRAVLLAVQMQWNEDMGKVDDDATSMAYDRQIALIRSEVYA